MLFELHVIDGVALQQADLHGLAFRIVIAHAASSHRISVGQTREQLPPRMFCFRMPAAAPLMFSSWILRMKAATSISDGQMRVHGAS
jgi:hypothetical protein